MEIFRQFWRKLITRENKQNIICLKSTLLNNNTLKTQPHSEVSWRIFCKVTLKAELHEVQVKKQSTVREKKKKQLIIF